MRKMRYRYAELVEAGKFEVKEGEIKCPEDKVLVRVEACGVCMWEVHGHFVGRVGSPPQRLGHEPAGVIVEVGGRVEGFEEGDRVTGLFGPGFATHAVADPRNLVKIPDDMPFEEALFEPMWCAVNVASAIHPEPGDFFVLVGCGFMGLLVSSLVRMTGLGATVAVDLNDEKLKLAEELGFEHTVNPAREDAERRVAELTEGHMADIVVEATGSLRGLELASKLVRRGRGRIVCLSAYTEPEKVNLYSWTKSPLVISAHPSYSPDHRDTFRRTAWLLRKRIFPMRKLVTHRFPLDRIQEAFEIALHPPPDYVKGVILPQS